MEVKEKRIWARGRNGAPATSPPEPSATASHELSITSRRRAERAQLRRLVVRRAVLLSLAFDVAMLCTAVALGLTFPLFGDEASPATSAVIYAIAVATMLAARGAYTGRPRTQLLDDVRRVIETVLLVTMAAISIATLATGDGSVAAEMTSLAAYAAALLVVGRVGAASTLSRGLREGEALRPTLILGAGKVGNLAAKRLLASPERGLLPVGFLDDDPLESEEPSVLPVLGAAVDLDRVISDHHIEHFIVGFSTAPHQLLLGLIRRCWELGVSVSIVPRLFEVEGDRASVDRLGGLPIVALEAPLTSQLALGVKYVFDRVAAGAALLVLSPLLLAIAAAIRITMGSPVLYRQPRVGRDGQHFVMLKFRTMTNPPEAQVEANAGWAAAALGECGYEAAGLWDVPSEARETSPEARLTPLGRRLRRMSIDELPQLWNVLRGEMSLIGPRPELPHYVERFEEAIDRYSDRHRVKSGMTGWAQVHGLRGDTSLLDRVEWDNYYIENWSLWLDVKIMLMTVTAVFRDEQ